MTDTAPFGRTVAVTTLAGLVVVGQMYAVLPLLPKMAASWGTTPAAAAWTATVFGLVYAAGFLLTGPLADRYGRRRVIAVGMAALVAATGAMALAPNLPAALATRAAQGLAAAAFSPAALAYLTERIEPRRRPIALTCLITAMVGAVVVGQLFAQAGAALFGWQGAFVIGALAEAALAVALWRVMLPDGPAGATRTREAFTAMARLLRPGPLPLIYTAALTVLGGFVAVYSALQLMGPPELAGHPAAMLRLRAAALPALVAVPFLAPVLTRLRPTVRAAGAMALAAAVAAVLGAAAHSAIVIALLLLVFVGALTAVSPALTAVVAELSGEARAAGQALYTFALLTGASLGPQLAVVLRGAGLPAVLWSVAALLLCGAALVLAAGRRPGSRHPRGDRDGVARGVGDVADPLPPRHVDGFAQHRH
ncbi:MFS transporter [Actinomadura macrotermitis]|uniref:Major facilitator superfamily (MFS) profile domain-containing protein n=1 Tax=Actinomadura macrotermitis TaxID=2585200 RepID=A0A7K0BZ64_9ACTN|nr:MFS transporter [Actinomadura macrotermitis]MQY06463.1 hypothetical protein [Actinomadura macrotermitis]